MHSSDRLRPHPDDRFAGPVHQIDLDGIAARLIAEPLPEHRTHRQETLYRRDAVTVALFVFEAGGRLEKHVTGGIVTVQVLQGHLQMKADGQTHDLTKGSMLIMAANVPHDVQALEASRMLLTISLEHSETSGTL